jgi:twitching motility protein PilT
MARIDAFLKVVVDQVASDLHLGTGTVPAIRRDGDLVPLPFRELTEEDMRRFVFEVLDPDQLDRFEDEQTLDFLHELPGVARFRGNLSVHARGLGAVFRIIPSALPTLEMLQLPAVIGQLCQLEGGLVLICGPTGSGKTTTLAAMINEVNRTKCKHIITVEDPVEFVHPSLLSVVSQRQVGKETPSFAAAVRAAMRESADVLVVGEMRDNETMDLALSAAEAGLLVLGTMHANSAIMAVHRFIDSFPPERTNQALLTFAAHFRGIVGQRLVRRATGEGRIAVMETVMHTQATATLIRENKAHQVDAFLEAGDHEHEGMLGMDASLAAAVRSGTLALADALPEARHPDKLREAVLKP